MNELLPTASVESIFDDMIIAGDLQVNSNAVVSNNDVSTFNVTDSSLNTIFNVDTVSDIVTITGSLNVLGNITQVTLNDIIVSDPLIKLGDNNVGDTYDIGFYGQYVSSGTKYAGLVRKAGSDFSLFSGLTSAPTATSVGTVSSLLANLNVNNLNVNNITTSQTGALILTDSVDGSNTTSIKAGNQSGNLTLTLPVNAGSASQFLQTDGSGVLSWAASAANTLVGTTLAANVVNSSLTNFGASIALGTPGSGTLTSCTGLPLTTGVTGTLPIANGGTNLTTYTTGDLVYASATNVLNKLADIATGNVLISGGVGVAPSYGKVGLTTHVSGTLPIANGGTNLTSTPTNGQLLIGNGSGYALAALTGTSNQVTVTNGAGSSTLSLPQDIATTSTVRFGRLGIDGDALTGVAEPRMAIYNTSNASFLEAFNVLAPNLTALNNVYIQVGKARAPKNSAFLGFNYAADNSNSSYFGVGFWNTLYMFSVYAGGTVQFNTYTTNGTVQTSASNGTLIVSSDSRSKNTINYFTDDSLPKIMALQPCSFKYNHDATGIYEGFIAQDVEVVLPHAVDGKQHEYHPKYDPITRELLLDEHGNMIDDLTMPRYRGLSHASLIAHLVKAVQELKTKNDALEARLSVLENA